MIVMVHSYVSVKRSVRVVRVSNHKTFRSCVDCGKPMPRSCGGVVERCRSCALRYRWKLYRESRGLGA